LSKLRMLNRFRPIWPTHKFVRSPARPRFNRCSTVGWTRGRLKYSIASTQAVLRRRGLHSDTTCPRLRTRSSRRGKHCSKHSNQQNVPRG
jgi:hypothetical protein